MAVISTYVPQAPQVTEWPLVPLQNFAASGNTSDFPVDTYSSIELCLSCTNVAGGGGVIGLNVWAQKRLADGVSYGDVAHFVAITGSTSIQTLSFINGGENIVTETNQTLASNSVLVVNIGGWWRVAWTLSAVATTTSFGIFGNFKQ